MYTVTRRERITIRTSEHIIIKYVIKYDCVQTLRETSVMIGKKKQKNNTRITGVQRRVV